MFLLIPSKFALRFVQNDIEKNVLLIKAGIGSIIANYWFTWNFYPKILIHLSNKRNKNAINNKYND